MINFLKEHLCFILNSILVIIICSIVINAVAEGIGRIITQDMINDTYRIHK